MVISATSFTYSKPIFTIDSSSILYKVFHYCNIAIVSCPVQESPLMGRYDVLSSKNVQLS